MASGTITIGLNFSDPSTHIAIQTTKTADVSSPIGTVTKVNLTTTPTALSIPSGARYILIEPPSTNTNNIKISGAVGETTGAVLDATGYTLLPLPASSPSVYLFAAAAVTGVNVTFL